MNEQKILHWKQIETTPLPKNGSKFLVYITGFIHTRENCKEKIWKAFRFKATCWGYYDAKDDKFICRRINDNAIENYDMAVYELNPNNYSMNCEDLLINYSFKATHWMPIPLI